MLFRLISEVFRTRHAQLLIPILGLFHFLNVLSLQPCFQAQIVMLVQQVVPIAAAPVSFSRASLIGDQPQTPPVQTPAPSGSSSSSSQSSSSKGTRKQPLSPPLKLAWHLLRPSVDRTSNNHLDLALNLSACFHSLAGSGLSGGDKAGIAVGVIAGVALLAGATYFAVRHRR